MPARLAFAMLNRVRKISGSCITYTRWMRSQLSLNISALSDVSVRVKSERRQNDSLK